jgi:hypothetical protein
VLGFRCGGHVVHTTSRPGVAPDQPLESQPGSLDGSEPLDRGQSVGRARGVVAARRWRHRRDHPLVEHDQRDERRSHDPLHRVHDGRPSRRWASRANALGTSPSSSAPNSDEIACAATGLARITTSAPHGNRSIRAAIKARSRRLVRLRTTAPPTALETTKPTRGGRPARASVTLAWTTISLEPNRTPLGPPGAPLLPRSTAEKSALVRSRCPAGSTRGALRRTARSGPYGDEPRGSRGRRGSACAGGSRGPWPDDGCSAGKYACSRWFSVTGQADGLMVHGGRLQSACRASRPQSEARGVKTGILTGCHGHAKTADRPRPRYASATCRVKPASPPADGGPLASLEHALRRTRRAHPRISWISDPFSGIRVAADAPELLASVLVPLFTHRLWISMWTRHHDPQTGQNQRPPSKGMWNQ